MYSAQHNKITAFQSKFHYNQAYSKEANYLESRTDTVATYSLNDILIKMSSLNHTSHISQAQEPHKADGHFNGQG